MESIISICTIRFDQLLWYISTSNWSTSTKCNSIECTVKAERSHPSWNRSSHWNGKCSFFSHQLFWLNNSKCNMCFRYSLGCNNIILDNLCNRCRTHVSYENTSLLSGMVESYHSYFRRFHGDHRRDHLLSPKRQSKIIYHTFHFFGPLLRLVHLPWLCDQSMGISCYSNSARFI